MAVMMIVMVVIVMMVVMRSMVLVVMMPGLLSPLPRIFAIIVLARALRARMRRTLSRRPRRLRNTVVRPAFLSPISVTVRSIRVAALVGLLWRVRALRR